MIRSSRYIDQDLGKAFSTEVSHFALNVSMHSSLKSSIGSDRRGTVLVLVLITIGMLSLGAYTFAEVMRSEYAGLRAGTDEVRVRAAASSGVNAVVVQLDSSSDTRLASSSDENRWAYRWRDSVGDEHTASIRSGAPGTLEWQQAGPRDESAKWNINGLSLSAEDILESRGRLMTIPGMTLQVADSLLDWIDEDENPREFGAESDWYLSKGLGYVPRQGPFQSLQELLLVRGVRVEMLFGEDANANRWLDIEENDGDLYPPNDNADHRLDAGWSQWLSVDAAESNLVKYGQRRGEPKVNVNDDNLVRLYRNLERVVGMEAARFIVAMRMNGPIDDESVARFDSPEEVAKRIASARARAIRQTTESTKFGKIQMEVIDGFAINAAPAFRIDSVVELLGRRVEAVIEDSETFLSSPWSDDSRSIAATLDMLSDRLTTSDGERRIGRINVHAASREVLMTIPGMTSDLATAIIRTRPQASSSHVRGLGWLYQNGLVDIVAFRRIATFITAHGDVYSGVSVGKISGVRQSAIASFLIDASGQTPRVRYQTSHPSTIKLDTVGAKR